MPNFATITAGVIAPSAPRAGRSAPHPTPWRRPHSASCANIASRQHAPDRWKGRRARAKLISREYQDEKHQHVLLVVDTGRRMLAREPAPEQAVGSTSHFDHALDAALVVGYLALRQGDAVGLFASGGTQRWMPPQRGMAALDTLLRTSYDLQPAPVAPTTSPPRTN